jgi:hypothetical protein
VLTAEAVARVVRLATATACKRKLTTSVLRYDLILARETAGTVERYRALRSETLLLGGDKSRAFLRLALDALEDVLPRVSRVRFERAGHLAPANDGAPERVAVELKRFFGR